jgi:hypothetical protein
MLEFNKGKPLTRYLITRQTEAFFIEHLRVNDQVQYRRLMDNVDLANGGRPRY